MGNNDYKVRLNVEFKSSYIFGAAEIIIRLLAFGIYYMYDINIWIYLGFNTVLFIVEAFVYGNVESKYLEKARSYINDKYKDKVTQTTLEFSFPGTFAIIYYIIGWIISFLILKNEFNISAWYWYVLIILLSFLFAFLFILCLFFTSLPREEVINGYQVYKIVSNKRSVGSSVQGEIDIAKEYPDLLKSKDPKYDEPPLDEFDYNDTKIAILESSLKGMNTKVEAYMLESVLLGALAFSGFLTIVASNILTREREYYNTVYGDISTIINKILSNGFSDISSNLDHLFARENLFILIMFESLLCSVFFILVLALRLRFSNRSLKMDHMIRIMNIFNAKEEELINIKLESKGLNEVIDKRHKMISKKIDFTMLNANLLLKELNPIAGLMSGLRNIGITIFFLILVTSGLFFSYAISLLILGLALATLIYRTIESQIKPEKIKSLLRRH